MVRAVKDPAFGELTRLRVSNFRVASSFPVAGARWDNGKAYRHAIGDINEIFDRVIKVLGWASLGTEIAPRLGSRRAG
jgi:hypothetical protein